jgi:hypothetical protein
MVPLSAAAGAVLALDTPMCAMLPDIDVIGFSSASRTATCSAHAVSRIRFHSALVVGFVAARSFVKSDSLGSWELEVGSSLGVFSPRSSPPTDLLDAFTNGGAESRSCTVQQSPLLFPVAADPGVPIGVGFFSARGSPFCKAN